MTEVDLDAEMPGFLRRVPSTKPLVLSYTLLNTYRNICPHQAYRRYVKKDIPFKKTEAMEYGDKVHLALEHRVNGGKPLPADMRQWEPFAAPFYNAKAKGEMKLGLTKEGKACDFFDDNVWFRGKIDVSLIVNSTTAFIADWKTGSVRDDPFELETSALLLNARFPELTNIQGCYIWLKENRLGQKHDLSHTRDTWIYVNRIAEDLAGDIASDDFEKRKSGLCGWCDVKDCENWKPRS